MQNQLSGAVSQLAAVAKQLMTAVGSKRLALEEVPASPTPRRVRSRGDAVEAFEEPAEDISYVEAFEELSST